jgi:uncharacterized membrane protein
MSNHEPQQHPGPFLPVRTAFILVCALLVGATAGGLTYANSRHPAEAVLVGGAAFGSSLLALHKLIA